MQNANPRVNTIYFFADQAVNSISMWLFSVLIHHSIIKHYASNQYSSPNELFDYHIRFNIE